MENPLSEAEATSLARRILKLGKVTFSTHAGQRMAERDIIETDVVNVIRCGVMRTPPELEKYSWRYTLETARMVVAIAFRSEDELVVVSTWHLAKKGRT